MSFVSCTDMLLVPRSGARLNEHEHAEGLVARTKSRSGANGVSCVLLRPRKISVARCQFQLSTAAASCPERKKSQLLDVNFNCRLPARRVAQKVSVLNVNCQCGAMWSPKLVSTHATHRTSVLQNAKTTYLPRGLTPTPTPTRGPWNTRPRRAAPQAARAHAAPPPVDRFADSKHSAGLRGFKTLGGECPISNMVLDLRARTRRLSVEPRF